MPSTHRIIVARIDVDVQRKGIRNLHVGVYLPAGRVRVAAPLRLDDDAVRLAIVSRIGWIRRQQAAFVQQVRQTPREYVSGESHYLRGRRYRLEVVERPGPTVIAVRNNSILRMQVAPGVEAAMRATLLDRWYRLGARSVPFATEPRRVEGTRTGRLG
jgi:predicted metal-dependent hydrolase